MWDTQFLFLVGVGIVKEVSVSSCWCLHAPNLVSEVVWANVEVQGAHYEEGTSADGPWASGRRNAPMPMLRVRLPSRAAKTLHSCNNTTI